MFTSLFAFSLLLSSKSVLCLVCVCFFCFLGGGGLFCFVLFFVVVVVFFLLSLFTCI